MLLYFEIFNTVSIENRFSEGAEMLLGVGFVPERVL
jgi:hypothetical protein